MEVEIDGKTVQADLWLLHDQFCELPQTGSALEIFEGMKRICEPHGITLANYGMGVQLMKAVFAQMATVQKKDPEAVSAT